MKPLIPLLLTFGLVGCGSPRVWYQPGKTATQARMDKADCRMYAQLHIASTPPPASVNVNVAVNTRGPVPDAGAAANGAAAGGALALMIERGRFVDNCMESKGYQYLPLSLVPSDQRTNCIR